MPNSQNLYKSWILLILQPAECWDDLAGRLHYTLLVVLVSDLIVGRSFALGSLCRRSQVFLVRSLPCHWDVTNPVSFLGGFNGDALSVVFAASFLSAAVTILMSIRYIEQSGTALAEFITILLTATLGMFYREMSW